MAATVPEAPQIARLPLSLDQSFQLYWDPPLSDGGATILDYRLTLIKQSDNTTTTSTVQPSELPYYTVTGLTNNQTYTIYVEARNSVGYGTPAYFRDYQPGTSAPNQAASATASAMGSNAALVSWTPPTGSNPSTDPTIFWYTIESSSTNASDAIVKRTANGLTQSNIVVRGLNTESLYTFNVRPVNCPGYGPVLTTSQLSFYNPGQAKLATRGGVTSLSFTATTVVTDSDGNVYMTMEVTTTGLSTAVVNIYNYTTAPVSQGEVGTQLWGTVTVLPAAPVVLVKYNSSGQVQWATRLPTSTQDSTQPSMATDSSGNVYYCGGSRGTLTFYTPTQPGSLGGAVSFATLGTTALSSTGWGYFLVKVNGSNGNVTWVTKCVSTSSATYYRYPSIATDASNNVYVCCVGATPTAFHQVTSAPLTTASWGVVQTPGETVSTTRYGCTLIKYNSSGAIQWISNIQNVWDQESSIYSSVTVDSSGNPIVLSALQLSSPSLTVRIQQYSSGGGAGGNISFTNYGTMTTVSNNGFIAVKFDGSSGAGLFAARGEIGTLSNRPYIARDSSNNIYITFTSTGIATLSTYSIFDYSSQPVSGGTLNFTTAFTLSTTNLTGTVLVKLNSSLVSQWATPVRQTANTAGQFSVDNSGNVYLAVESGGALTVFSGTGKIGSTYTFSQYGIVPYQGSSNTDSYLIKYNTSGTVVWATRLSGTLGDLTPDCSVDNLGNVYLVGTYASNPLTINMYASAPPTTSSNFGLTAFGTLPDVNTGSTNVDNIFLVKYAF